MIIKKIRSASAASLMSLVVRVRKPLAYWWMFQLTVMSISHCDTCLKIISDVNVREDVHDTVHLDFGRS